MATKLGKAVTYYEKLPPIKSYNPLNKLPLEVKWKIRNFLSPLLKYFSWPSNLAMCLGASFYKVTKSLDQVVLQGHETKNIHYISTTKRAVAIEHGKMRIDKMISSFHA